MSDPQHPYYDDEFDDPMIQPATVHEALAAIRIATEADVVLPAGVIYRLSELHDEDLAIFQSEWAKIPTVQRRLVMSVLTEVSEGDYTMTFEEVAYLGLDDPDAAVRAGAIEVLWWDMSEATFIKLLQMAEDENPLVRSAVMTALARFIEGGEMEEFPMQLAQQAQEVTVRTYNNTREDVEVRRHALEAIAHCSHPQVGDMIREAYYSDDLLLQQSALFAMGRTYDEQWSEIVIEELESEQPELRFEAVRAAGELVLEETIPTLAEYAAYEEDYEIRLMAIWSLGEIATPEAQQMLRHVAEMEEENEDDELFIAIEEALENAMLMSSNVLPIFRMEGDIDLDDLDDEEYYDDEDDDEE
jgi:HEAT repeat protein